MSHFSRASQFVALCLVLGGHSARAMASEAEPPEPVHFVYRAPDGCPTEQDFLEQVRASGSELRLVGSEESARTFSLTIDAGGQSGRLVIDQAGPSGVREINGSDCAEVTKLLAFALGLALDAAKREAVASPENSAVVEAPVIEPRPAPTLAVEQDTPNRASTSRRPLRARHPWALGASGLIGTGRARNPTFGAAIAVERTSDSMPLAPRFRLGIAYTESPSASVEGATVHFRSVLTQIDACGEVDLTLHVQLLPCLSTETGIRMTWARDIPNSRTQTRLWLALGASGRLRFRFAPPAFAGLGAGVLFPLRRDRVYLQPDYRVHKVPAVGAVGEVTLGFEFGDQSRNGHH